MSKHVKDKISLFIDGMLEDAEREAFEAHIKTCGECAGLLASTKSAVKKAKNVQEQPLPVNFYAKLNQKLDAIDAKKDAFTWSVFMRGAAAVFTMLIVGVFVYNIKNQTNNFRDVRVENNAQMPAEEAKKEKQADVVLHKAIAVAPLPGKPALKKKAAADLSKLDSVKLAEGNTGSLGLASEAPVSRQKAEVIKSAGKKAAAVSSAAVKSYAPAAKMQESSSPAAGMAMDSFAENEARSMTAAEPAADGADDGDYDAGAQGYVIKSESEWNNFTARGGFKDQGGIDWASQMVVSVFLTDRPSEGYSVEITGVEYMSDRVVVTYKEHKPAPDSLNAQVITRPHAEKVVKKSALPVDFKEVM